MAGCTLYHIHVKSFSTADFVTLFNLITTELVSYPSFLHYRILLSYKSLLLLYFYRDMTKSGLVTTDVLRIWQTNFSDYNKNECVHYCYCDDDDCGDWQRCLCFAVPAGSAFFLPFMEPFYVTSQP